MKLYSAPRITWGLDVLPRSVVVIYLYNRWFDALGLAAGSNNNLRLMISSIVRSPTLTCLELLSNMSERMQRHLHTLGHLVEDSSR
jgi:hypothetical protein